MVRKVKRFVTGKRNLRCRHGHLGCWFPSNTTLADVVKIELFPQRCFLVDKKQETSLQVSMQLVIVIYDNARGWNELHRTCIYARFVQVLVVPQCDWFMNWKESVFKVLTVSIYSATWFQLVWLLKKQSCRHNATETGFNDIKNLNLLNMITMRLVLRLFTIKTLVKSLELKWYHVIAPFQWPSTSFSLAIQEHVTIDSLALTGLFFLPHFNKPCNYIHNGSF